MPPAGEGAFSYVTICQVNMCNEPFSGATLQEVAFSYSRRLHAKYRSGTQKRRFAICLTPPVWPRNARDLTFVFQTLVATIR